MKTLARLFLATLLTMTAGCARTDWIDRTLVTVDVTGTWSGTIVAAGGGGGAGAREVVFELEQQGPTVKGHMRITPRGLAPEALEGTVAGDVFRFRDPRGGWEGELTVSGDEMDGRVSTIGSGGHISLRRVDPSTRPASPPR